MNKCPKCHKTYLPGNGCPTCARERKALGPSDATACSPFRVAYSRAELADKLKDWMIELWGDSPKNLEPEQRDQWHRDNGMIYHFICDHFPENAIGEARVDNAAPLPPATL